jgi:hypothetical protein
MRVSLHTTHLASAHVSSPKCGGSGRQYTRICATLRSGHRGAAARLWRVCRNATPYSWSPGVCGVCVGCVHRDAPFLSGSCTHLPYTTGEVTVQVLFHSAGAQVRTNAHLHCHYASGHIHCAGVHAHANARIHCHCADVHTHTHTHSHAHVYTYAHSADMQVHTNTHMHT